MKFKCRNLIVAFMAVLALGAVASASASAFNKEWEVCSSEKTGSGVKYPTHECVESEKGSGAFEWKKLAGTEELKTVSSGGEVEFSFAGKNFHCTKVTGKGNIKTGGAGEATEIKFTGCTANANACTVESSGAPKGTIITKDLPTLLVERNEKLADELKQNATTKEVVTIEFDKAGAACPEYPTGKVKGQIAAEVRNLANGNVELNFPSLELRGNALEYFGFEMRLTGKLEVSLENGSALRAK